MIPVSCDPLPALSALHQHRLGVACAPRPGPLAVLVLRNQDLLAELGLGDWGDQEIARLTTGAQVPPEWTPFASRYAGHQFGSWAGQLGDGRALTLAHVRTARGVREIQLKGAGSTPYSRMGDGRAVLRSSLREMWAGEFLHALGVPTTRCAALALNGLEVARERVEPGACVLRTGTCFIRPGHFEALSFLDGEEGRPALLALLEHAASRWFPALEKADPPQQAAGLLRAFAARTGTLVGSWMAEGFVHGVMNTDNFALDGTTLDFGPYAFMERFDPAYCPNHTDQTGLYAWHRQPEVVRWNLSVLAAALAPVMGDALAKAALEQAHAVLDAAVQDAWDLRLGRKLGLEGPVPPALAKELFACLQANALDHTLFFVELLRVARGQGAVPEAMAAFAAAWRENLRLAGIGLEQAARTMAGAVPLFAPRLALLDACIAQTEAGDLSAARSLLAACQDPFGATEAGRVALARWEAFNHPPAPDAVCSELSCSS